MNNSYVPIYNYFEEVMLKPTYWLHFYKELWISIWEIISNASYLEQHRLEDVFLSTVNNLIALYMI